MVSRNLGVKAGHYTAGLFHMGKHSQSPTLGVRPPSQWCVLDDLRHLDIYLYPVGIINLLKCVCTLPSARRT